MDDPQAKMMADAGFRSVVAPLRGGITWRAIRPHFAADAGRAVIVLLLIGRGQSGKTCY